MKKITFVLGYTGGILALVFSLLMIYLVPINFVSKTVEDIKYEMKNENVVAFNEVALYSANHPGDQITDYSESGLIDYASRVAKQSGLAIKESVYEDTMAFVYRTALDGIISVALVGISIIFAILAFIGSLVVRKHSTGGAVFMLVSSLILLLSAIYTGTLIPMAAASAVLAAAGILAFIPEHRQVPAEIHARNRQKAQQANMGQQYPQPGIPAYASYPQFPQQPQAQPQFTEPPQTPADVTAQASAPEAGVPFPEEDVQVFEQPNPDEVK
jgi:hypothetical protein